MFSGLGFKINGPVCVGEQEVHVGLTGHDVCHGGKDGDDAFMAFLFGPDFAELRHTLGIFGCGGQLRKSLAASALGLALQTNEELFLIGAILRRVNGRVLQEGVERLLGLIELARLELSVCLLVHAKEKRREEIIRLNVLAGLLLEALDLCGGLLELAAVDHGEDLLAALSLWVGGGLGLEHELVLGLVIHPLFSADGLLVLSGFGAIVGDKDAQVGSIVFKLVLLELRLALIVEQDLLFVFFGGLVVPKDLHADVA